MGVPLALLAAMALVSPAPRWMRGGLRAGLWRLHPGRAERRLCPHPCGEGGLARADGGPAAAARGGGHRGDRPRYLLLAPLRYADGAFADNGRQLFRWHPQPHPADLYTPDHITAPIVIGTEALAEEARRGRVVWVLLRRPIGRRRRMPPSPPSSPAGRGGPPPPRAGATPLVGAAGLCWANGGRRHRAAGPSSR